MPAIEINLSKKQAQAYAALENRVTEELFFGGAAGPGKTFLLCFWQIMRRIKYPNTVGLIGRNVRKDLYDTTLETFFRVCRMLKLEEERDFRFYDQKARIEFNNESIIFLRELRYVPRDPDFQRLGSLELTDAGIDEAPEIKQSALDLVSSRIRYNLIDPIQQVTFNQAKEAGGEIWEKYEGIPKVFCAGNPANNWAKFRWIKNKDGTPVELPKHTRVVSATLADHPDPIFREQYRKQLLKLPLYHQERLLRANWDVIDNAQPFFMEFDPIKHVAA